MLLVHWHMMSCLRSVKVPNGSWFFRGSLHQLVCILIAVSQLIVYMNLSIPKSLGKIRCLIKIFVKDSCILLLHSSLLAFTDLNVITSHHLILRSLSDDSDIVSLVLGWVVPPWAHHSSTFRPRENQYLLGRKGARCDRVSILSLVAVIAWAAELLHLVRTELLSILRAKIDGTCAREEGCNLLLLETLLPLMGRDSSLVENEGLGVRELVRKIILQILIGRCCAWRRNNHLLEELIAYHVSCKLLGLLSLRKSKIGGLWRLALESSKNGRSGELVRVRSIRPAMTSLLLNLDLALCLRNIYFRPLSLYPTTVRGTSRV